MGLTKGFVTIATGKEEYYMLAVNLLNSYHYFCSEPLSFAVLSDRENEYTKQFDDTVIMGNPHYSYLDKLEMYKYLPYDVNIFIDADCLAYGDLNKLFDFFKDADDFSCFGRVLPLDDKTGWFEYKNLGELKDRVSYVVGLHGGIYYMKKGLKCESVFKSSLEFAQNYNSFKFKGKFDTPGDEPLAALSMAVHGCRPIVSSAWPIRCYWEYVSDLRLDMMNQAAKIKSTGDDILVLHWGTRFTREPVYKKQTAILDILRDDYADAKKIRIAGITAKYNAIIFGEKVKKFMKRVVNKLYSILGSD